MEAEKRETPPEKEIKLPVFSVLKKGSILKHIVLNSPESGIGRDGDVLNQEEEPILIGRHPDCHIVLDHPSISRFHLEVRIETAKQKLSVIDRSSVHGTWVSGTKIQPHVPVDLVDGDMLRLGASTRLYRFRWVPLSRASEMERPMEPLLEEREETYQEEIPMPLDANSDDMSASKLHSGSDSTDPSSLDMLPSLPLQMESQSPVIKEFVEEENLSFSFVAPVVESACFSSAINGENGKLEDFSAVGVPSERPKLSPLGSEKRALSSRLLSRRSKSISHLRIPNGRAGESTGSVNFAKDMEEEIQEEDIGEQVEREGSLSKVLFADIDEKEIGETFYSAEETSLPRISADQMSKKSCKLQNSPSNVVIHLNAQEEVFNSDKENWTPEVSKELKLKRFISASFVENKEQDTCALDEGYMTVGISFDGQKEPSSFENSPSGAISDLNLEEDIFHSDREIQTPESSRVQRRKEQSFENHVANEKEDTLALANEKDPTSFENSPSGAISAFNLEEDMFHSDRETQTPEYSRVQRRKEQSFEDHVANEKEDTLALDMDNVRPQLSFDRVLRKNSRDLPGSSSIDILSLNVEENQFQYDRVNWTPEVSGDLNLERPISENNASNKRDEETLASDKENSAAEFYSDQKWKVKIKKPECESDKENQTPEVPRVQKLKKPVFENCETNAGGEDLLRSNKENLPPDVSRAQRSIKPISKNVTEVEGEIMRKRVERIPLQLLLDDNWVINGRRMVEKCNNSYVNSVSADHHPVNNTVSVEDKSNGTLNQLMGQILPKVEQKKIWNIVADTSCFLNEEFKRSLQLLEGLKGTHLIVPMMVVRELDCMKRHESWFRKETKASSALKWIAECMLKSSWWIHVQSSSEMMPVAATPPASPHSLLGEGNSDFGAVPSGLMASSTCRNLMEIISPTAEDHILDTALHFKRIKSDGQLVLLSNNITLKIKAMAEGLLCETPKEFRDSLVNPYSKRSFWKECSPTGSTWFCSDQMPYTENYCHQMPNMRKAADSAPGLKLILLHNSHYAQTMINSVK